MKYMIVNDDESLNRNKVTKTVEHGVVRKKC